uniref:Putative ovule protein n=1 Tax=Solanum chacoense TaxID=4108 RepID=A0A0V0HTR1_SOLCH
MDAKLPEVILFKNEKDLIVEQKVLYEWKPTLCCFCSKYGHSEDECRKKKAPMQRQRPEKQVAPLEVTSDVVPIAHGVEVDSQETQVQENQKHAKTHQGEMQQQWQNKEQTITAWITPNKLGKISGRQQTQV